MLLLLVWERGVFRGNTSPPRSAFRSHPPYSSFHHLLQSHQERSASLQRLCRVFLDSVRFALAFSFCGRFGQPANARFLAVTQGIKDIYFRWCRSGEMLPASMLLPQNDYIGAMRLQEGIRRNLEGRTYANSYSLAIKG